MWVCRGTRSSSIWTSWSNRACSTPNSAASPAAAGRARDGPTKLYRRSSRQVSVTLPERRYELAGTLLAQAVDEAGRQQVPVLDALDAAATDFGRAVGDELADRLGPAPAAGQRVTAICDTLAGHGYEPRLTGAAVTLVNCPFDALARDHTALICGMNLAVLRAVADRAGDGRVAARLDPGEGRCCVVLDIDGPAAS